MYNDLSLTGPAPIVSSPPMVRIRRIDTLFESQSSFSSAQNRSNFELSVTDGTETRSARKDVEAKEYESVLNIV